MAPTSEAYNCDCMEYMRAVPDGFFDLAVVDPPYGINVTRMSMGGGGGILKQESTVQRLRNTRLKGSGKLKDRAINTMPCDWDLHPPGEDYFRELFRVSRNQVIWGGNYFPLPPTQKPVALYAWIYRTFASEGQRILDTHLGSGSSRIAAYRMGLDFWGCEIDSGYYRSQEERFMRECLGVERVGDREVIQGSLFQ